MPLESIVFLAIVLGVVAIVPVLFYAVHRGGRGSVWGVVSAGEQVRGGIYRFTRTTLWKRGSAPLSVRIAAFSSFFLGQMIVPGFFAACFGFLATLVSLSDHHPSPVLVVLTLSSPTGLVVAAYLFAAGIAMLERANDAVVKARRAARWALTHNVVLLLALAGALCIRPSEAEYAAGPAIYALVSLIQALIVRYAAFAMEVYAARQEVESAPAEVREAYWATPAA